MKPAHERIMKKLARETGRCTGEIEKTIKELEKYWHNDGKETSLIEAVLMSSTLVSVCQEVIIILGDDLLKEIADYILETYDKEFVRDEMLRVARKAGGQEEYDRVEKFLDETDTINLWVNKVMTGEGADA